ncbi:MAG: alpha/beta hydrolase domain-containing protein, partial [Vicinamibacterales bacterium]
MKTVAAALCILLCSAPVFAEVTGVTIASRSAVANGQPFGATGSYEKLTGTIEFALDPRNPQNTRVVDLDRADRAADGRVHFTADLVVLRPVDPARGNGVLLFEVVNRGRIGLLTRFNSAPGSVDPVTPADFGNGYLMREGYTLVMVGWEFDIPPGTIHLEAPRLDGLLEPIHVSFVLDRK